jgi:hypothetical protein
MIQLIGPGGAGKSTIGAALAMRLGCPPALGDLRFQLVGIIGSAGVFPIACLLLAILFGKAVPANPAAA